ncbi:MAG: hypothetical protein HYX32_07095 [Actinobacteria bacterium]|nr:hypothetical protein [Actinomycetota bacterium]
MSSLCLSCDRDYDPTTGTFLTRDPLGGDPAGKTTTTTNSYAYGYNDPLNRTDPLGLRSTDAAITAASKQSMCGSFCPPGFLLKLAPSLNGVPIAALKPLLADLSGIVEYAWGVLQSGRINIGYSAGMCLDGAGSLGPILGVAGSAGFCFFIGKDDYWAIGAVSAPGIGTPIPGDPNNTGFGQGSREAPLSGGSASITAGLLISNADSADQISQWGICFGGSSQIFGRVGGAFEICISLNGLTSNFTTSGKWTAYVGLGVVVGFEMHAYAAYTGARKLGPRIRPIFGRGDLACTLLAMPVCPD